MLGLPRRNANDVLLPRFSYGIAPVSEISSLTSCLLKYIKKKFGSPLLPIQNAITVIEAAIILVGIDRPPIC